MKNPAVRLFIGILLGSIFFTGCGKNEATQAAKESVETEKEGVGENEETKDNSEEKNSSDKTTDSKSETTSADTAQETKAPEEEPEEELDKVGILLPEEGSDINSSLERSELKSRFSEAGYEPVLYFADEDADTQIGQIRELLQDEKLKALIISPVDSYSLTEVLGEASEQSIPVFDYDSLIMDTDKMKYYVTFDTRSIGKEIGETIIKKENLDKVRDAKESRTIEFLMGSPDDEAELFLFNGIKEALHEYIDDGTLICRSGNLTFDQNGIMRGSTDAAMKQLKETIDSLYAEEQTPDIICTASDAFALGAVELLKEENLIPGTEEWPLITGVNADAEAVKSIAEGKMGFTVLMDRRDLAEALFTLVDTYLKGEDVEVSDYSQYDNGVKIIGTVTCDGKVIDKDNYQILVDNGFYLAEMIEPDATPTPTPEEPSKAPESISKAPETISQTPTPAATGEPSNTPEITTEEVPAVGKEENA